MAIKKPTRSIVDSHPQKAKIIEMILAGDSVMKIGRAVDPPLNAMMIQRYRKNVVQPLVARADRTQRILRPDLSSVPAVGPPAAIEAAKQAIVDEPILSVFRQRLEKLHDRVDRSLDRAEASDLSLVAPLLSAAHKNVEMLGRATGELEQSQGAGFSIQIICPSAPSADSMPRISYGPQMPGRVIEARKPREVVDDCVEIGVQRP